MEHTALFEEQVTLTPRDMRNQIDSIDRILLEKLQAKLEGRCSRHGYVKIGSIKVLSRSMGVLEKGRFTGSILFHLQAEGDVLNPPDGIVLEGEVIRKNKMGMYISYEDAVRVILPRDLHIGNEEFESVAVGDTIRAEVKKSRFQVNDPYILSVGIFRGLSKKSSQNQGVAAMAATAGPAAGDGGAEEEERGPIEDSEEEMVADEEELEEEEEKEEEEDLEEEEAAASDAAEQ